jgi:hypothetical protein
MANSPTTFTEITFQNIKNQIELFLRQEHNKAGLLYSPASPYGQILNTVENLFQLSILYLKNSINSYDLSDPNSTNEKIIRNAAIFAGHNPGRAISATGTLKFQLKTTTDVSQDIPGGKITINDRTTIRNKTNGLEYSITLGLEKMTYNIQPAFQFFVNLTQGSWTTKNLTGTGEINQTFHVSSRGQIEIENFNYEVIVNGQVWQIKKHLYDLLPDENSCVVKTGFDNGVDIIFGNGGFGAIPPVAAAIQFNYLQTDGSNGSIFRRTSNDWSFIDNALDGYGNTIDLTNLFDIQIYTDINFGADKESISFTKNVLPIVSNNFVLGLPQQYAYQIKRLGVFSHVNAYLNNGTIFIVATPNIQLFKNQNADYFAIDISAFTLDAYEISKIDKYLRTGGNIQLTQNYVISSPTLSYYIMNVFIITYSDSIDSSVNSQIYDTISSYFLSLSKTDRIPKVDIISQLALITDLYSVDIQFVSKNNEDYHRQALATQAQKLVNANSRSALNIRTKLNSYNPNQMIGIDPIQGDITFTSDQIPIIRGGWYDRNNIYYSDSILDTSLKSVNIIKTGTVDSSQRPQI